MKFNKIPFYKTPVGDKEIEAVAEVIRSGWMTTGEKTTEFESKFADYIGAPFCVMVDSCTDALNLSLAYWKKNKNKQKINSISIPSLAHLADASALLWNNFEINFEDLEKDESFCMKKTNNYSIPLHYAGKYNNQPLPIIEDCAHRIMSNSFSGVTSCFSFYSTKNITTGGNGGMIACRDKQEAEWYKKARYLGVNMSTIEREKVFNEGGKFWEYFQSEFLGYKCEPTDIQAAIGLIQLSRINELNNERKKIADLYNQILGRNYDRETWNLYPILINKRDEFIYAMKELDIHCSVHWLPLHKQKTYNNSNQNNLPVTEWVYDRIVSLPFYPYMEKEKIEIVAKQILDWERKFGRPDIKKELN